MKPRPVDTIVALLLLTAAVFAARPAHSAVSFDYIFDSGLPFGVSNDGTVVAGELYPDGGTFRWTQATGPAYLGRLQKVGTGGSVGVSADGSVVASSIASLDSSYTTFGRWTQGSGWQELMPPAPADGGIVDGTYGNAYGLSGDGSTVVGLYWRPGAGNRAHAAKWTQAAGVVDLGGTVTSQSSRANGANFDGSVITGWVETPTGPWRPVAWVNGSAVLLTNYTSGVVNSGEGRTVSPNGDLIAGFMTDSLSGQRAATLWKRTAGVFGPPQVLGWVAGTSAGYGANIPYRVSSDGRIVIGYCTFQGDPFYTTGFVWTAATGVIDVNVFLANNGVYVDPNFTIASLTAMTPDGTQLFGYGTMLTPPYTRKAFRITVPNLAGAPAPAPVARLELSAPSPNPTSAGSRLEFALATPSPADLSIFDAAGRRVATLVHADLEPARRAVLWDGRDASGASVPAGLYFARLTTSGGSLSRRIARVQ